MHELGIVFHIADEVTKIAKANNAVNVKKVVLEIGEVSTVVNSYLEDCWNWNAKRSEILKDCKLDIITIPAVTYCEDCKGQYPTVRYGKTCPHCGSGNTYLLRGNETNIKEIAVE